MDLATEAKLDQEITCSQCQEVFKQPKILSCMHTFCTKCIEPFIDQCSKKILCTLCSRTTEAPDGIASLTSNFVLQNVIDALDEISKKSEGILKCGECEQDVATTFCCDCYQKFCSLCTSYHQRSKKFKSHTIFEIDDVSRSVLYQGRAKTCSTHDIILRYFCDDCKRSTCHDCTISSKHDNHTYFLLDDIVLENKNELHDLLEKLQKKIKFTSKSIHESENILQNIEDLKEKSIQHVNETFEKIEKVLFEKKEKIINKLEESFRKNKESLDYVKLDKTILEDWAQFTSSVLDNRGHSDIMDNYMNLKKQLESLTKMNFTKKTKKTVNPDETQIRNCPRKLMRNPNSISKPRISARRKRAQSVDSIHLIGVEGGENGNMKTITDNTTKRNVKGKSQIELKLESSSKFQKQVHKLSKSLSTDDPYSSSVSTFLPLANSPVPKERKVPPPRPPPANSFKRRATVCSIPTKHMDTKNEETIQSAKQNYVISVTKKPRQPKRLPPPPPINQITPSNVSKSSEVLFPIPPTTEVNKYGGNEEVIYDNFKLKSSLSTSALPISTEPKQESPNPLDTLKIEKEMKNDKLDVGDKLALEVKESVTTLSPSVTPPSPSVTPPSPPPRFSAGIKFIKQNVTVNQSMADLLMEFFDESFKIGKKERNYQDIAYGDVLFEITEDIIYQ